MFSYIQISCLVFIPPQDFHIPQTNNYEVTVFSGPQAGGRAVALLSPSVRDDSDFSAGSPHLMETEVLPVYTQQYQLSFLTASPTTCLYPTVTMNISMTD